MGEVNQYHITMLVDTEKENAIRSLFQEKHWPCILKGKYLIKDYLYPQMYLMLVNQQDLISFNHYSVELLKQTCLSCLM